MDYLEQIERLENRIEAISSELSELKLTLQLEQAGAKSTAASAQAPERGSGPAAASAQAPERGSEPAAASAQAPERGKETFAGKKKEKLSLEEKLGGRLMGIVAAVLVFIGLILFGTIVYDALGDMARVGLLMLISAGLLVGGLLLHKRKPSGFSLSLTGCGFGAAYLTLFMTRTVFNLISTEVLYGLLVFWVVGIGLFVWKYRTQVVAFLGLLGITMSVLFGVLFLEAGYQYVFLVIYFIVLSGVYLWLVLGRFLPQTAQERYPRLLLATMLLQSVQILALAMKFGEWYEMEELFGQGTLLCSLLSVFIVLLPVAYHLREHRVTGLPIYRSAAWCCQETSASGKRLFQHELSWIIFGWYQIFAGIALQLLWCGLLSVEKTITFVLYFLFATLVWLATELLGICGTEGIAAAIVHVVMSQLFYGSWNGMDRLWTGWFLAALLLFFGFCGRVRRGGEIRCGKTGEKLAAIAVLLLTFLQSSSRKLPDYSVTLAFVLGIVFFAVLFVLLYLGKKPECTVLYGQKHADGVKFVAYFGLLFLVFAFLSWKLPETENFPGECKLTVILLVLTALNAIFLYGGACRKLMAPDREDGRLRMGVSGINQLLWIIGMFMLHGDTKDYPVYYVLLLLQTLFLCVAGFNRAYKQKEKKKYIGIYIGLRITLYVLVVLTTIRDIPGFVISCAMILLALLGILAGFWLRLASLRLYGLVLTMLAVLKLMMLDVRHDNSMETVGCFLIAGVLCFCINLVYNKVKERWKD